VTGNRAKLAVICLMMLALSHLAFGQAAADSPLTGRLNAGSELRYEIETTTSYSADLMEGYKTTAPLGPCQYSLFAVLTLTAAPADADGNIPVKAEYRDAKVTSWRCARFERVAVDKSLRDFAASPVVYQVGPHGEAGFQRNNRDRFTYQSAANLLSKITLDLLQTRIGDGPVSVGGSWKPHGQFTYWKDYLLSGLELSAATMRWKGTPRIAGRDCAWITSRYVFAPTESSGSNPVTAGGTLRQQPTNVVAGVLDVSLLFDTQNRHIAWLDRSYRVDNHVSVKPEEEEDPEVLTVRWVEEGKARFISEKDSVEWMAALKTFESTPDAGSAGARPEGRTTQVKKKAAHAETDTLDFTPPGFNRWERKFCESSWYCTQVSVALPGDIKVVEDASQQTVYLAKTSDAVITVTVGPILPRKFQGLTPEEELKKQSEFFLANQLWMMNHPGISLESEDASLDGYSARTTIFRGQRRDLTSIQGTLAVLLSPWGESVPITCAIDQRDAQKVHSICGRIIGLARMLRPEQR
jgi:hypothetical protein